MSQNEPKIMLIDDDLTTLEMLEWVVRRAGYEVVAYNNGKDALCNMVKEKPDLVILDYMMPEIEGDEIYRELITNEAYAPVRDVPVIILTALGFDEQYRHVLELGVKAYLKKPFGNDELINLIKNQLTLTEIEYKNKELQQKLHLSEQRYRAFFENMNMGVIALDDQDRYLIFNRWAERLLETNRDMFINKNVFEYSPETNDLILSPIIDFLRMSSKITEPGNQIVPYHSSIDDSLHFMGITSSPVITPENERLGTVFILKDVTEEILREDKQQQLELELVHQNKLASIGLLVNGIAHNLKGPLSSISIVAQTLQIDYPELREPTQIINKCGDMEDIINNMLRRSRQEQDTEVCPVDINLLLQEELKFLRADSFFKNQVYLSTSFDQTIPPIQVAYGDLSQSFLVIIQNALDAMYFSKRKELKIRTYQDQAFVYVDIEDSGEGIPDDALPKIFEPYFTTKPMPGSKKNSTPTGSGIGLATCKRLLEPYGITFRVESECNNYTIFTTIIPKINKY